MNWGIAYCLGLGFFAYRGMRRVRGLGFRTAMLHGMSDPILRNSVFFGCVLTLVGGIAHRWYGFSPDVKNPLYWAICWGFPLVAFMVPTPNDPVIHGLRCVGMYDQGVRSIQMCVVNFPVIFEEPVWNVIVPIGHLRDYPEYLNVETSFRAAMEKVGDVVNKAVAVVEMAKFYTRARDWGRASRLTQEAVDYCQSAHGDDPSHRHITEMLADALCWRGIFVAFGGNDHKEGRKLIEEAKALYDQIECSDGAHVADEALDHIRA